MGEINGSEMAKALEVSVRKYVEAGILEDSSYVAINPAVTKLRKAKNSTSWEYTVSQGEPIKFAELKDRRNNKFNPLIMVEKICVDTSAEFPYQEWVTVLVLEYQDQKKACPRWHFDLGNGQQPGPRLHLQYGGHYHDDRELDESLKEPRWSTFPLDTVLLMEVVAANFFEEYWKEFLRDDRAISKYVKASEGLCYRPLIDKLKAYMDDPAAGRDATFLNTCWNDIWN